MEKVVTTKAELLKRIRLNCVECFGGPRFSENKEQTVQHAGEIAECPSPECAFYPFRFGKDPKPSRRGNKEAFLRRPGPSKTGRESKN